MRGTQQVAAAAALEQQNHSVPVDDSQVSAELQGVAASALREQILPTNQPFSSAARLDPAALLISCCVKSIPSLSQPPVLPADALRAVRRAV